MEIATKQAAGKMVDDDQVRAYDVATMPA